MWWVVAWAVGAVVAYSIQSWHTHDWISAIKKRGGSDDEKRAVLRLGLLFALLTSYGSWVTVLYIMFISVVVERGIE